MCLNRQRTRSALRIRHRTQPHCSALINENGDRHTFTYDGNERLIEEKGFDGRRQTYRYDPAGHLIQHRDGEHIQTDFERDPLGQLLSKLSQSLYRHHPQPPEHSKYRYDPLGRVTETYNEHQYLAFDYDYRGNITREHQHDVNHNKQYTGEAQEIRHTYNHQGQRTHTETPKLEDTHNNFGYFLLILGAPKFAFRRK